MMPTDRIPYQPHAVIILGSGESSRLGQPKQLLTQNGQTLIGKVLQLALATSPLRVTVVVPATIPQVRQALIHKTTLASNNIVHIIDNPTPSTGMGDSLALAVDDIRQAIEIEKNIDQVLILVTDQIFLDSEHALKLLRKNRQYSKYPMNSKALSCLNHHVAVSHYPKNANGSDPMAAWVRGVPLAIHWQLLKTWLPKLHGDAGLRSLIRALPAKDVSFINNTKLSYDIDNPLQLAHARESGFLD